MCSTCLIFDVPLVDTNSNGTEYHGTEDVKQHNPSEEYLLKGMKLFKALFVLFLFFFWVGGVK
jgi:hypothetical protein